VILASTPSGHAYWYLTRGSGVVALVLLTASVALGIGVTLRARPARLPRFAVVAVHRSASLLALAFVCVHVLTTVLDSYTPIALGDAFVPFASSYRPIWLGLGAVAFDVLLAVVATSLLRGRLSPSLWRGVHWLAYACWPLALVHALGTGSDASRVSQPSRCRRSRVHATERRHPRPLPPRSASRSSSPAGT
jgi:DMSO/TMAO reductase YedYZ heme-binding membrane subunit